MGQNNYYDELTQIHNEPYLQANYHEYLKNNPNSKLIMIDFEKFKTINDLFGHNIGDKYLILFAKILSENFPNSIVIRAHGDEFSVLTAMTQDEIRAAFQRCDNQIAESVKTKQIPRCFSYNAGSSFANADLEDSKEKADIMMYSAKNRSLRYQPFSFSIWLDRQDQKDFLTEIGTDINEKNFTYFSRDLFDKKGNQAGISHITTKNAKGHSLFYDGRYSILRNDSRLVQFDIQNMLALLRRAVIMDNRIMFSIDYKTILNSKFLYNYFEFVRGSMELPSFDNIILAINTSGIDIQNCGEMIQRIATLKELGFKVCIDKYDNRLGDLIWENSDVDYVRFEKDYWKSAITNPKTDHIIRTKVNMFSRYNHCQAMFGQVESPEEYQFISSLDEDILVSGNYYGREKKLILKR